MVTWSSGSFFSDRVLRGRCQGRRKTEKIDATEDKSWDHEFLYKLCPMPSKFILQYSLLYTVIMRNHQGQ